MSPASSLTLTAELHESAIRHLFPGDGLEAAAILVCARTPGPRVRLLARKLLPVPYDQCDRQSDYLRWPGTAIEEAIELAEGESLSLVLLHSHPGGLFAFSRLDDASDRITMPGLFQAIDAVHGSAIMVPSGAMLGRIYQSDLSSKTVDFVAVPGQDLKWWWGDGKYAQRPLAFTSQTTAELGLLRAGVIGVSGTGSIVAEQAARLGFGEVLLIDFDHIEPRNLNRILNSTLDDAKEKRSKVEVFTRAIDSYRGKGVAVPHHGSIMERDAVLAASQCDVLFCCVDTHDARQLADLAGAAFLIPLFEVGVTIPTGLDDQGMSRIIDVRARIDYVRPGGPTLQDRGVYSQETLRAEQLRRHDPAAHAAELGAGYIKGTIEQAPSVVTLNMRFDGNARFVRRELSIADGEEEFSEEAVFSVAPNPILGRGDQEPLLMLPKLSATARF